MKLHKIKSSTMRKVAGAEIPRSGMTSKGVKSAMKKGGHAFAGESGEVDGEHAKHRLDRPGRRHGGKVEHHKHGGMACKKDGGNIRGGDGEAEKEHDLMLDKKMAHYAERKHGGHVKEPHHEKHEHRAHHAHGGHAKHHEKHEHEEHHKHGGHVKKK